MTLRFFHTFRTLLSYITCCFGCKSLYQPCDLRGLSVFTICNTSIWKPFDSPRWMWLAFSGHWLCGGGHFYGFYEVDNLILNLFRLPELWIYISFRIAPVRIHFHNNNNNNIMTCVCEFNHIYNDNNRNFIANNLCIVVFFAVHYRRVLQNYIKLSIVLKKKIKNL